MAKISKNMLETWDLVVGFNAFNRPNQAFLKLTRNVIDTVL